MHCLTSNRKVLIFVVWYVICIQLEYRHLADVWLFDIKKVGLTKAKRTKDLREVKGKGDDGWESEERRRSACGVLLSSVGW